MIRQALLTWRFGWCTPKKQQYDGFECVDADIYLYVYAFAFIFPPCQCQYGRAGTMVLSWVGVTRLLASICFQVSGRQFRQALVKPDR